MMRTKRFEFSLISLKISGSLISIQLFSMVTVMSPIGSLQKYSENGHNIHKYIFID